MSFPEPTPAPRLYDVRNRFVSHFVESVLLTWMGNLLRIAVGLVALRLVTSMIAEVELGTYWVLTSVAALLSTFADLGMGISAARHLPIASDRQQAQRLMHTLLWLRIVALAVLCGLVFACKPFVLRLFDAQIIEEKYYYVYVFIAITSLVELYTSFLQGMQRFRAIAVFALLCSLTRFLLILVLVRQWKGGVDGLFIAEVVAMLLALGLAARGSSHGLPWQPTRVDARRQLRFGLPLYLNTLLANTVHRVNTVMIGSFSGPAAVSYFSVAWRIPDQLVAVLSTYNSVYLPNMSRILASGEHERARRLLAASLRLISFCFAMLALVLTFFRHEVLAVLAPPSYGVAAAAVPLLVGSLVFSSLGSIMGSTIVALGDSRTPVRINFWTGLIGLVLNWILIQRWGFMGAAWAMILYHGIGYTITDAVLARRIRPENRSYLGILAYLAAVAGLGFRASLPVRAALLVCAAIGSLLLSRGLRRDVVRVWNARLGPRRESSIDLSV